MNTTTLPQQAGAIPGASAAEAHAKQPRGLYVLFLAEMWERFSYYGMRGLLVLYLVNAMHMSNADAQSMYGVYTGLVYVTPLIGGYLADKFLGARLAAIIGGSVMMLGHFAMAVPSLLYVALGLLIVGNGFFKPNTSSMVGMLYPTRQDPRIDSGYTIFYMGINLGAFIANLVSGTLGEKVGYHWGFASAGVCMGLGLASFLALQRFLGRAGLRDDQQQVGWKHAPTIAAWSLGSVVVVYGAIQLWHVIGPAFSGIPPILRVGLAIALLAGAVGLFNALRKDKSKDTRPLTRAERGRVLAVGVMVLFVVFFWMGFEQAGGSMNLFAAQKTDRVFFG